MRYAALSDKGKVRKSNEDSVSVILNKEDVPVAFIVADGMGGCLAGETASRLAIEFFSKELKRYIYDSSYAVADAESCIARLIRDVNTEIYDYSQKRMQGVPLGTTISAGVCFYPDKMVIVHIGDSRVYLIRDLEIRKLTTDHSYVGELVKQGILNEKEARVHPKRNQITRALGYEKNVEAEIFTVDVHKDDIFIFCSDGLYNKVSAEEMLMMVRTNEGLDDICKNMVNLANRRGGDDNITVIVLKC